MNLELTTETLDWRENKIRDIFIPIVYSSLFNIVALYLYHTPLSFLAQLVSAFYVLYAITQGQKKSFFFVVFALANTKGLCIGGVSCSVVICAYYSLSYFFSSNNPAGGKLDGKFVFLLTLYCLYSTQFIIRYNSIKLGMLLPIKMALVLVYFYNYSQNLAFNKVLCKEILRKIPFFLAWGLITTVSVSLAFWDSFSRVSAYANDSNMLSVLGVFTTGSILTLYFLGREISLATCTTYSVVMLFICMLSGSRTGAVLLITVLLLTFLSNSKRPITIIIVFTVLVITTYFLFESKIGQQVITIYEARTNAMLNRDDISNGRIDLWKLYYETFNKSWKYWLFGLGDYGAFGIPQMAHNFILEDICAYGVIGMVFLLNVYLIILRKTRHVYFVNDPCVQGVRLYALIPLLIPFIGGVTLHSMTNVLNTSMIFVGWLYFLTFGHENSK